jgi:hypothetical protein
MALLWVFQIENCFSPKKKTCILISVGLKITIGLKILFRNKRICALINNLKEERSQHLTVNKS